MNTARDAKEFDHAGSLYRVWEDGVIERYDGPKLGWNLTHSAMPRATARELELLPEGN